ncbi:MAG: SRPBCC family protein [Longispora sp.]|nr:SRPBCC family protein [Longispora sp. (in: high G+C Gram-positive bacteria)]
MTRASVTTSTIIDAPTERVYAALVDWSRQHEWIPFTTVRVASGDGGVDSEIEAITAWGPLRLVDLMRVIVDEPPHRLEVMHHGSALRGPGRFECVPLGENRTRLLWEEDLDLPRIPGAALAWPLMRPVVRASLTHALRRLGSRVSCPRQNGF